MKSYHGESGGSLGSLVAKEHSVPHPGPYQVLIRVWARPSSRALDGQVNLSGRLSDESTTINMDILYRAAAGVRVVFRGPSSSLGINWMFQFA